MNRRRFLSSIVTAAAAFSILPAATTYKRHWVKPVGQQLWVINPEWVNSDFELAFLGLAHIGDGLMAPEINVRYRFKELSHPIRAVRVIPNIDGSYKVIPQYICQTR